MKINLLKLSQIPASELNDPHPEIPARKAGILIPIYQKDGKDGVVLTKRNANLRSHPGQISFPGGVGDDTDEDLKATAYREIMEEIGVSDSDLEFIAPYKPFHTFTGYIIYPYLAYYNGNFEFTKNPEEVEKIILLDLESFLTLPFYMAIHPRRPSYPIYYLDLGDDLLWGATGYILVTLLRELCGFERKPKLVSLNLPHPPFLDLRPELFEIK